MPHNPVTFKSQREYDLKNAPVPSYAPTHPPAAARDFLLEEELLLCRREENQDIPGKQKCLFFPIHFFVQKHLAMHLAIRTRNHGIKHAGNVIDEGSGIFRYRSREKHFSVRERQWKNKILRFFPMSLALSLQKFNCLFSSQGRKRMTKKKNERDPQSKRIPAAMESEGRSDTTEQTFQVFLSLSSF